MELIEIKVGEDTYKVKKLSAYQVTKTIGPGGLDLADVHVNLILASVVEPKMKREDVLILMEDEEKYYPLIKEIERINEKGIRALGNYIRSSVPSQ